eukprot:jgi/Hompol1/4277/HPOL_003575-RA
MYSDSYEPRGRGGNGRYSGRKDSRTSRADLYGGDMDSSLLKSSEQEATDRCIAVLFALGDKSGMRNAIELASSVMEKEMTTYKSSFFEAFRICLTQVPHKIGAYATMLGLINNRNFDAAIEILLSVRENLNAALAAAQMRSVKLLVRFFAECLNANVVLASQLIGLFDTLLAVTLEPNVHQARSDAFVFVVLAALPYAAKELAARASDDLDRILAGLELYFLKRQQQSELTGVTSAMAATALYRDSQRGPYPRINKLDLLWIQIKNMRDANWELPILFKTHEMFESQLSQALQHNIPEITVPSSLTDIKYNYQPKFWIFDDSLIDGEQRWGHLPHTTEISRFILDDIITDIIRIYSLNHKECSRILLNIRTHLNLVHITDRGYNTVETVIECIFSELLRLPTSQERSVYYETLIIDMCKDAPDQVPVVFGRSIKTLYSRLDAPDSHEGMDVEGVVRISELFAHHLSNFGYQWKWQDWISVLDKDPSSAQFVFVRETLERCIRLAYFDRIKNSVPEAFEKHSVIFPASAPSFKFKFETSASTGDEQLFGLIKILNDAISSRREAIEVERALEAIQQYAESKQSTSNQMAVDGVPESPQNIVREALIQCVMLQGSKSFSHVLNVIERYITILQSWNSTIEARMHTIQITTDFWHDNTQFIEIILDKLTNYRIVDPKTVLSWVFQTKILDQMHSRFFLWSIVRNTLIKVNLKLSQVNEKIEAAKAKAKYFSELTDDSSVIPGLEATRETCQREKKETFIMLFQKYVDVASEKVQLFDAQQLDVTVSPWWRWVVGFFREMSRVFKADIEEVKYTMDTLVFRSDVDPRVSALWTEFKALSDLHLDETA